MCHQINQLPASFSRFHRNKFVQKSFRGLLKVLRTQEFLHHIEQHLERKRLRKHSLKDRGEPSEQFVNLRLVFYAKDFLQYPLEHAAAYKTRAHQTKPWHRSCTEHPAGLHPESQRKQSIYLLIFKFPSPSDFFWSSTDQLSQHQFKAK